MMIDKEKVLSLVKEKGPVIPRDIVKALGGDTFLTGAVLSQLADTKHIKISSTKIGGSPVYYVPGQEHRLQDLYNHLHEKERRAYDLLKEKKIIRDSSADPVLRVALRGIRDFAKPLEVNINGNKEIFWKWFLLSNEAAEQQIRNELSPSKREPPAIEKQAHETEKNTEQKSQLPEIKKEQKKEEQMHLKKEAASAEQKQKRGEQDWLLQRARKAFEEKDIEILDEKLIRRNTEMEMIVLIPSSVGKLKYLCKIRAKKKSNDKDLSSAFVDGQLKNLPVLYVTTGELTNKAAEKAEKEYKTLSVLKI